MSARVVAQRFAFVLLLSAAIALMLLGKTENPFVERLRAVVTDAAMPVLTALSHPITAVRGAVAEAERLVNLQSENVRLSGENERMRRWESAARNLERENAALRAMLNVGGESTSREVVTARVIGDSGGPFVRTMLLDAGARRGVRRGQAAVNGDGLVGRVVETGERSSRILLLTDLNSRVPVVVESSRYRAILAGDNSARPRLIFAVARDRIRPGDRIVTSGHGGMFPPGLPVGMVTGLEEGVLRLQPFVDWDRLVLVQILEFEPPAVEDASAEGGAGSDE